MGDMDSFSVDHGALSTHIEQLAGCRDELRVESDHFLDVVAALDGVWQGETVGPWSDVVGRWHGAMTQINNALDQLVEGVLAASGIYVSGDQQQAEQLAYRQAQMEMPGDGILQ